MKKHMTMLLTLLFLTAQVTGLLANNPEKMDDLETDENAPGVIRVATISSGFHLKGEFPEWLGNYVSDVQDCRQGTCRSDSNLNGTPYFRMTDIVDQQMPKGKLPVRFEAFKIPDAYRQPNRMTPVISALETLKKRNKNRSADRKVHILYLEMSQLVTNSSSKKKESLLRSALQDLREQGVTILTPAGDRGRDVKSGNQKVIPAVYPETITFSALEEVDTPVIGDKKLRLLEESNFGEEIDIGVDLSGYLRRHTRTAAAIAGRRAVQIMVESVKKHGSVPGPEKMKKRLIQKAKNNGPIERINDPDNQDEPILQAEHYYDRNLGE